MDDNKELGQQVGNQSKGREKSKLPPKNMTLQEEMEYVEKLSLELPKPNPNAPSLTKSDRSSR